MSCWLVPAVCWPRSYAAIAGWRRYIVNNVTKLFFFWSLTDLISLLILFVFLLGQPLQKSLRLRRFQSDRDKISRECSSSKYASESDFRYDVKISRWRLWRHFRQKTAATWWVNTPVPDRCDIDYAIVFIQHVIMRLMWFFNYIIKEMKWNAPSNWKLHMIK